MPPTNKLNVLQVLPNLDGGGVEKGTLEVAQALVERGHHSLVISGGGRLVAPLEASGTRHIDWRIGKKSPFTLKYVGRLRRLLGEQRIDVLHARSRVPAWVCWLALKGMPRDARPRFVTSVHGFYSVSWYSEIMTRGERVEVVSESVRDYALENYSKLDASKVELIYRGIDPEAVPYGYQPSDNWKAEFFHEFPKAAGKSLLVLPGRLTRLKGHLDFLAMLDTLRKQVTAVHGLIVGSEDPRRQTYAEELRAYVREHQMEQDVTFTGHRSDLKEIFAISRIAYVLSTQPESFGRTALEAISLGVPVIGYDHGGVREILSKLFPEGCVPLQDHEQLLARTVTFLAKRPQVEPHSEFRLQAMLDGTLEMYERLCGMKQTNRVNSSLAERAA